MIKIKHYKVKAISVYCQTIKIRFIKNSKDYLKKVTLGIFLSNSMVLFIRQWKY